MLLTDYIDSVYGTARGNRARFLKDNPDILPQELSRWLKAGLKIRPETGEIYKPVSRRVRIPSAVAAGAGVFLSDDLRERVASLATAQNVTSDAMLNALVVPEGVNEADLRKRLLNDYHIEVSSGLGSLAGKIIRIDHFGCIR